MFYVLLDVFVAMFIGMMVFLLTDRLTTSIIVILLSSTFLVSITVNDYKEEKALNEKIEAYVGNIVYNEDVDINEIKLGENDSEYEVYVKIDKDAEQVNVKYIESVDAFTHDIIQLDTLD